MGSADATNQGKVAHVPVVTISPGRSQAQVAVEIAAPVNEDVVDYIWAADAETGEIFAARKFVPKETPRLQLTVDRGRRIVPSVHCARDGVWVGEKVLASD